MAVQLEELSVKITADTSEVERKLDNLRDTVSNIFNNIQVDSGLGQQLANLQDSVTKIQDMIGDKFKHIQREAKNTGDDISNGLTPQTNIFQPLSTSAQSTLSGISRQAVQTGNVMRNALTQGMDFRFLQQLGNQHFRSNNEMDFARGRLQNYLDRPAPPTQRGQAIHEQQIASATHSLERKALQMRMAEQQIFDPRNVERLMQNYMKTINNLRLQEMKLDGATRNLARAEQSGDTDRLTKAQIAYGSALQKTNDLKDKATEITQKLEARKLALDEALSDKKVTMSDYTALLAQINEAKERMADFTGDIDFNIDTSLTDAISSLRADEQRLFDTSHVERLISNYRTALTQMNAHTADLDYRRVVASSVDPNDTLAVARAQKNLTDVTGKLERATIRTTDAKRELQAVLEGLQQQEQTQMADFVNIDDEFQALVNNHREAMRQLREESELTAEQIRKTFSRSLRNVNFDADGLIVDPNTAQRLLFNEKMALNNDRMIKQQGVLNAKYQEAKTILHAKATAQFNAFNENGRMQRQITSSMQEQAGAVNQIGNNKKALNDQTARLGRAFRDVGRHLGLFKRKSQNANRHLGYMARQMRRVILNALLFRTIGRAIGGFTSLLGNALRTNQQFAHSLNMIRANLFTAFYGIFRAALPAINALMSALVRVTHALATFIAMITGRTFEMNFAGAQGLYRDIADGTQAMAGGANDANEAYQELQRTLMGFDEINQLNPDNDTGGADTGGGGGAGGGDGGIDWGAVVPQETPAWLQSFYDWLRRIWNAIEPTRQALGRLWYAITQGSDLLPFITQLGRDFLNSFLIPVGMWAFGTEGQGLPRLLDILTRFITEINWTALNSHFDRFFQALSRFTIASGEGLIDIIDLVLEPLARWTITEALPRFLDTLSNVLDILTGVINAGRPAFEWFITRFITPIAEFVGSIFLLFWDLLNATLEHTAKIINENEEAFEMLFRIMLVISAIALPILFLAIAKNLGRLSSLFPKTTKFFEGLRTIWRFLKLVGNDFALMLKKVVGGAFNYLKGIVMAVWNAFRTFGGWLAKIFKPIWLGLKKIFGGLGKFFGKVGAGLLKYILAPFRYVKNWLIKTFNPIWQTVKRYFSNFVEGIKKILKPIGNLFKNIWGAINKFFLKPFGTAVSKVLSPFTNIFKAIFKPLAPFLKPIFKVIAKLMGGWVIALVALIISFALDWEGTWEFLGYLVGRIFRWIVDTFGDLPAEIWAVIVSIGNWFAELPGKILPWFADIGKGIWEWITVDIPAFFQTLWGYLSTFNFSGMWEWIYTGFIDGFITPIVDFFAGIWAWIRRTVIDPFMEGFRRGFGINSPSTEMYSIGDSIIQGLINGILGLGAWFAEIWDNIWGTISGWASNAWDTVSGWASDVWGSISETWSNLTSSASETWSAVTGAIGDWASDTWGTISGWASDTWGRISETWGDISSSASETWDNVTSAIGGWASDTWSSVTGWASNVWGRLTGTNSDIETDMDDSWANSGSIITDWASDTWSSVTGWASNVWGRISGTNSDIEDDALSTWEGTGSIISDFASDTWSTVSSWTSDTWSNLSTGWSNLSSEASSRWGDIRDNVSDRISTASSNVQARATEIGTNIRDRFNTARTNATNAFNTVRTNVSNAISTASTNVRNRATEIGSNIRDRFNTARTNATNAFNTVRTNVTNAISTARNNVRDRATEIGNNIRDRFNTARTNATNAFNTVRTNVTNAISTARNNVRNRATEIGNNIRDRFNTARTNATNAFNTLRDNVTNRLTTARNNARNRANEIRDNIRDRFNTARTNATNAFNTLRDNVTSRLTTARNNARNRANEIRDNIRDRFNTARTNATNAFNTLRDNVTNRLTTARTNARTRATDIANNIRDRFNTARTNATNAFNTVRDNISSRLTTARQNATNRANEIRDNLQNRWNTARTQATTGFNGVASNISSALNTGRTAINNVANTIRDNIRSRWTTARNHATTDGDGVANNFRRALNTGRTAINNVANTIRDNIRDRWRTARDTADDYGQRTGNGFANGLQRARSAVMYRANNIANAVTSTLSNALNINSPSLVLQRLGEWAIEGFGIGLESRYSYIMDICRDIAEGVRQEFSELEAIAQAEITLPTEFERPSFNVTHTTAHEFESEALLRTLVPLVTALERQSRQPQQPIIVESTLNIDGRQATDTVVKEVNRRTRQQGFSPFYN